MNKFIKKICATMLISIIGGSMVACGGTTKQESKENC